MEIEKLEDLKKEYDIERAVLVGLIDKKCDISIILEQRDKVQKIVDEYNFIKNKKYESTVKPVKKEEPKKIEVKEVKKPNKKISERYSEFKDKIKKTNFKKILIPFGIGMLSGMAACSTCGCTCVNEPTAIIEEENKDLNNESVELKDAQQVVIKENIQENKNNNNEDTFTDATDVEQVIQRANEYYDTYLKDEYDKRGINTEYTVGNKEILADAIAVINGGNPIYQEFNVAELNIYGNNIASMIGAYLSLENATNNGFAPSKDLFIDGSLEQKAAAQVDASVAPCIEAINNNDDEAFKKYAAEFGKTLLYQYVYVDYNPNYVNVRGNCSAASKNFLYRIAHSQYATKLLEYGISKDIDVCIDYCIDNNTGEMRTISLSSLIAMLDYVPVAEWDSVLARSGITAEQVRSLGNSYAGQTMSNIFIEEARNYHYSKNYTLKLN